MEEFKQGFVDEALQLADKLEELILQLEIDGARNSDIQEIFRVMHTIKGSSAMFGFNNTEKITHNLEDIYDLIRDKKLQLNKEILNLTINTVDIVKFLLSNEDVLNTEVEQQYLQALSEISIIYNNNTENERAIHDNEIVLPQAIKKSDALKPKYYYILFKPDNDILQRGIAPINVFDELSEYGKITGFPFTDDVPLPEEYNPSSFFLAWDIFIETNESKEEIEDCFLFYLDHEYSVIEIQPSALELNKEFLSACINLNNGNITIADIKVRIGDITNSSVNNIDAQNVGVKKEVEPNNRIVSSNVKSVDSIKVDSNKLDELINLVSELVTLNSRLQIQTEYLENDDITKTIRSVSKLSKRFRDNALELRLMPVKVLVLKLQRLVRDLSKSLNKEVEFITQGTNTELDKNIISKLEGVLIHILRNSLDHGIESADERRDVGKPEKGVIRFIAFYSGANVFIQIQDDGAGIDIEKVKQKAIERKLISKDTELGKQDIFNLLFSPGFSTARNVTNVSGRGVGLDVVKKEIADMRGEIDIESEKGLGTSFTLKLPLTLSIIDTLLTKVNEILVLIPREYIVQTNLYKSNSDDSVIDKIEFENNIIPVISLSKEFNSEYKSQKKYNHIIVKQHEKYYAIGVDSIIGEHQAVVKPLGCYSQNHNYFSGASIMGDASLAFILDVNKVIGMKRNNNKVGNYNLK